ncbi:hypothetical protein GCM10025873_22510 [Demequina sediminis]|uniref:hypothetical protein n=1 Tax=Demequina sediminis TaxID=1930058 RepID=UPI0025731B10|nr:hypothetical protein [Demequina sediminis]BDZ62460.1 hypothetical protein GCM10025873_22510 [Demequina sediminis]
MTAVAPTSPVEENSVTPMRVVGRVVLPTDSDPDTLPLYLDLSNARAPREEEAESSKATTVVTLDQAPVISLADSDVKVTGRRSVLLHERAHVSFATYFNAFPAAYWRRWTDVDAVRLDIELSGPATLVIYKSNARGRTQRVELVASEGGHQAFDLPCHPSVTVVGTGSTSTPPQGTSSSLPHSGASRSRSRDSAEPHRSRSPPSTAPTIASHSCISWVATRSLRTSSTAST